ncbi:unnamed protein product, partial [Pylaiella littoralis]
MGRNLRLIDGPCIFVGAECRDGNRGAPCVREMWDLRDGERQLA